MNDNEKAFLLFDLNLPFTPDVHDVIYVENEYEPATNGFIQEHYEEIQQQFLSKKATFIYLPKLCGQEVSKEALHYMFPFLGQESSFVNGNLTIETLKSHILSGSIEGPALIHFVRMEAENAIDYYYTYRPLVADTSIPFSDTELVACFMLIDMILCLVIGALIFKPLGKYIRGEDLKK